MKRLIFIAVFFLVSVFSVMNVSCTNNVIVENQIDQISTLYDYNELINNNDYIVGDFTETFLCTEVYGGYYDENLKNPIRYEKADDFNEPVKTSIKFTEKHENGFPTFSWFDGDHLFDWSGSIIEKRIVDNYILYYEYFKYDYVKKVALPSKIFAINKYNKTGFIIFVNIEE